MKKILFLLLVFSYTICTSSAFEFVDNKKNGALDPRFIKKLVDTFHADIFFETGTYAAETTLNAAPFFKSIVTVELHAPLFLRAKTKLAPFAQIQIYHGKSPDIIRELGPKLQGTILFWLDAHYSGEGTALSSDNPAAPEAVTAIREELAEIKAANIRDCVILIDDIRGFGSEIARTKYLGWWAYPTVQEVERSLRAINPNFETVLLGDMLLAYDKYKYKPLFSDTVIACTKTRLYDGYNLSDQELLSLEEKIKNAPNHEKVFIKELYDRMTNWKDPMFWHDLWYGLTQLGEKNYAAARIAIAKVKMRHQYLNARKEVTSLDIPYDHWRIDQYLAICN